MPTPTYDEWAAQYGEGHQYDPVSEDSVYTDLEDILADLFPSTGEAGFNMEMLWAGDGPYTDDFGFGLDYGDDTSMWNLYLDDYFSYNPETGSFETDYSSQIYKAPERQALQLGLSGITSGLESSAGEYRGMIGRSLGGSPLDVSDLASLVGTDTSKLYSGYSEGIYDSQMTYYEEALAAIDEALGAMDLDDLTPDPAGG